MCSRDYCEIRFCKFVIVLNFESCSGLEREFSDEQNFLYYETMAGGCCRMVAHQVKSYTTCGSSILVICGGRVVAYTFSGLQRLKQGPAWFCCAISRGDVINRGSTLLSPQLGDAVLQGPSKVLPSNAPMEISGGRR